jgi:glutamine amidotransferase
MTLAIIDYGSGNLRSAAKAFERAARESGLATKIVVTADPNVVAAAERIVLPGVGAFADCRKGLYGLPGMVAALTEAVQRGGRPFMGICVGMQLLASRGLEHGSHAGLDWIEGEVVELAPMNPNLKIPHMGWNELTILSLSKGAPHPVLAGIAPGAHAYFVHSYYFKPARENVRLADTDYGGPIAAVIGRDNIVGTQFHPEKSQATGLTLVGNFLRWRP